MHHTGEKPRRARIQYSLEKLSLNSGALRLASFARQSSRSGSLALVTNEWTSNERVRDEVALVNTLPLYKHESHERKHGGDVGKLLSDN